MESACGMRTRSHAAAEEQEDGLPAVALRLVPAKLAKQLRHGLELSLRLKEANGRALDIRLQGAARTTVVQKALGLTEANARFSFEALTSDPSVPSTKCACSRFAAQTICEAGREVKGLDAADTQLGSSGLGASTQKASC